MTLTSYHVKRCHIAVPNPAGPGARDVPLRAHPTTNLTKIMMIHNDSRKHTQLSTTTVKLISGVSIICNMSWMLFCIA